MFMQIVKYSDSHSKVVKHLFKHICDFTSPTPTQTSSLLSLVSDLVKFLLYNSLILVNIK